MFLFAMAIKMRLMSVDGLLDKLDSQYINDYLDVNYDDFDNETDFIDYTRKFLDGANVIDSGDSLTITTESIHQSPVVRFPLPDGRDARKELADFLFLIDKGSRKRAMITQAKFAKSSPSWDIDLYQYYLISNLPQFTVSKPRTGRTFDFSELGETSFSNFVFAGWFDDPFYTTGQRIKKGVSNFDYSTDNATFNRSNLEDSIAPVEYTRSILKRFIRGTFGVPTSVDPELSNLIDHLEGIVAGDIPDKTKTDGGSSELEGDSPGFVIIRINIDTPEEYNE